ncbi:MAG: 5-methyltetrahydropteroyltriglutamate--homocysteine S-methyltransferase [Ardenticatenaceae bacterium]|nr:5-methyltetrahydropteroyltriglutamate--homocysteine S-methyltransferase [Ardenticatenaceae bacterium]
MLKPPFRAEHVGSLLRPRALKEAGKAWQRGELSQAAFDEVLGREVARAVRLQESVGLRSITDGEFGRSSWFGFFFERMTGFTLQPSRFRFHDEQGQQYEWPTCFAVDKMRRTAPICVDEFERLQGFTTQTAKANMPSPTAFHFFRGDQCRDEAAYPDIEMWWQDLIAVYQAEIRDLAAAGCRYLQIDEVPAAMLCDPDVQDQVREMGHDPGQLLQKYIGVVNEVLAARPPEMTVGMHLCRGNFRSRWMAQGGYDPIAEAWFNQVNVDAFFLEYDSERAGTFAPLQYVGVDKQVVLGLITSKTADLEDKDTLKRRVAEAAAYMPLERLSISPQCGFASVAGGNALTEEEQMRKLALVVEVADEIWGEA